MDSINQVLVRQVSEINLQNFLESHDYLVHEVKPNIYKISRDQIDVFLIVEEKNIFFELEVGDLAEIEGLEIYQEILNLNTEVLPVSFGLDTKTNNSKRLLILESRERENLDENEILSVFESIEIALFKIQKLLTKYIK